MTDFAVIGLPANLGLRPSGVERLPAALRRAGLITSLGARDGGQIEPAAAYDPVRDPRTGLLNGPGLRDTVLALAESVAAVMNRQEIPLVLAGDCSVVLGGLLGLRKAARTAGRDPRVGLLFVDGHVDFYQPEASPTGEVADMDLALATGRGPDILSRLDPSGPLVLEADVAAVGARDAQERKAAGSQEVERTGIHLFDLPTIRLRGIDTVARDAVAIVTRPELANGFWLHLDADVLDDDVMPAVDYRQPGGLAPAELATVLKTARRSGRLSGMSVAIYNPALDAGGRAARVLVDALSAGLLEE
ncbi:MAG: arginase family protein [Gemmatimonadales bacterium]